jgi:hypothetical protein
MKLGRPHEEMKPLSKLILEKNGVPSTQAQPIIVSHFFLSDSYNIFYAKHFLWHDPM